MKKPELLAPAGNFDSLKAAIMAGCDAVYLGGTLFGARAFANNFNDDELVNAIKYSHLYGVKVYVTVNILIYDSEVDKFLKYIDFLHKNNVDAIIIQDLGMFDLVRKTFPKLEIHCSTQMHIHNLDGVQLMEKLGAKRVVLARETSIDTIKEIKKNTSMPIEIFVHGALCVSYSGQCLMSSLIGGRSGNRGSCAGCCRLPYDVINLNGESINDEDYPLSTKDLNSLDNLDKLIELGVDSFKIEGRMKSPAYVYMVVSLYREAIDNYMKNKKISYDHDKLYLLRKIFNRNFTTGFLFNTDNNDIVNMHRPNHQGVKIGTITNSDNNFVTIRLVDNIGIGDGIRIVGKEDYGLKVNEIFIDGKIVKEAHKNDVIKLKVNKKQEVGKEVLITLDESLTKKIKKIVDDSPRKVLITGKINAIIGKPFEMMISDGKNEVCVKSDVVTVAKNCSMTKEKLLEKIKRIGYSIYEFSNIEIEMDNNVFLSLALINDCKRKVIELLNEKRLYSVPYEKSQYYIEVPDFKVENIRTILIDKKEKLLNNISYDELYCEEELEHAILKLPRVIDKYEFKDNVLVGEIGAFQRCKNIYTDFSLNVTNSYAIAFLHSLGAKRITLSYELTDTQIKRMVENYHERYHKHPNLEVIVQGFEEVMILKFSLGKYYNNNSISLRDRFNNIYPIRFKNNLMYIYNYKKRDVLTSNYYDMGINSIRINYDID